ncbi:hypothetical protein [Roseovarius sp. SYSU LYC5161]|uniref:hypothetical protein n=1 Tax=Roseovarius halophilus (ex Wu et al. 2025) TaxID=3376060 RepID=UPI00399C347A
MKTNAIALILALAFPTSSIAKSDCILDVVYGDVEQPSNTIVEDREIKYTLINESNITISGALVEWELWSNERPLPLDAGSIRELIQIPGALKPSESALGIDYHFMNERTKELAKQASELTLIAEITEVYDLSGTPIPTEDC